MIDPLSDLARTQRTILAIADLEAAGLTAASIRREVRAGHLVRLGRGAYTLPDRLRSPESRHLLRAYARRQACHRDTVLTHHSAALSYGLPAYGADLAIVHLGRPGKRRRWRSRDLVVHALPPDVPLWSPTDVPRVGAAYAVVQMGLSNGPRSAVAAADAALRGSLATEMDLAAAVAAYRGTPGIGPVRQAVKMADRGAESPGESVLRYGLMLCGYRTETQPNDHRFRLDVPRGPADRGDAGACRVRRAREVRRSE